jgi:PiT family inorganic phosphate transporter
MISLPFMILLGMAGFYLGWNIGANDGGNCIGTSIGAGLISFRRGAWLVACFALLGAVLQGSRVVGTVGRGVVSTELPALAILLSLLAGGIVVTLATAMSIPVSTSQAVVGGLVGAAWSMHAPVNAALVGGIALSWVLCPIVAMTLGAGGYLVIRTLLRRITVTLAVERVLGWMVLSSACYAAYSLGANNVGNAVGPLANLKTAPMSWLLLLGGSAIAAGVVSFGRRVAESIGKGIVPLDLPGAFAAQLGTGLAVHIYALIGIPVSTSHAVVGAVVGVGLLRGIRGVGRRKITTICVGWFATPSAACAISLVLCRVLMPA